MRTSIASSTGRRLIPGLLCLMAVPAVAAADDAPAAVSGQKPRGVAVEAHVATRLFSFAVAGNNAGISVGAIEGGIFGGYKIDRFIFGLGFDISRLATGRSMSGAVDQSDARTAILFTPGVRVAILRSSDQRVELFGLFDIGLGTTVGEQTPSPPQPAPGAPEVRNTDFHLAYNIAPGVRYWVHPQFALAAVAGVHGDFNYNNTTTTIGMVQTSRTDTTTLTSIFAALQFTGVF